MSFSPLPTVLAQIIMQQLEQSSLLQLSRCNRSTFAAASSTVAFRFLPTPSVCSLQPQLAERLHGSLLRFCPRIHPDWLSPHPPDALVPPPLVLADDSIQWISSLPPLYSLDAQYRRDLPWERPELFVPLQSLRVLRMHSDLYGFDLFLHSLDQLTDLTIECPCVADSLPRLTRLTALDLSFIRPINMNPIAAARIGECIGLRRLTLRHIQPFYLRFIFSERMRQLDEFTLIQPSFVMPQGYDDDSSLWYAQLSSVPQLRSVSVLMIPATVDHIRPLSAGLRSSASLRCLRMNHAAATDAHEADVRNLLALFPNLERLEFELPVVHAVSKAVQKCMHVRPGAALRCRDIDFTINLLSTSEASARKRVHRLHLHTLAQLDRRRVHIVEGPVTQTALERELDLREQFASPQKNDDECCIS